MTNKLKNYEVEVEVTLRLKLHVLAANEEYAEYEGEKEAYDIARYALCNDYDVDVQSIEEIK